MTGRGLGKDRRSLKHLVPGSAAVCEAPWTRREDAEPAGVASRRPHLGQFESNTTTTEQTQNPGVLKDVN